MEKYLLDDNAYCLVLRLKNVQSEHFVSYRQLVKYSIVPHESPYHKISRIVLLVSNSVDVSAYQYWKNIRHQLFQADTAFCEKLLLHWAEKLELNHPFEDFPESTQLLIEGKLSVLTFLGTLQIDTVSEEIQNLGPQFVIPCGIVPGLNPNNLQS